MKKLSSLLALALFLASVAYAAPMQAPPGAAPAPIPATPPPAVTDGVAIHTLGNANAPVTVNEYVSLTCPHCAEFYNTILPDLEKNYIDTGKVKFVLHDFALNGIDLKAFALASCMPADEFFPFISVLYKNQMSWAVLPDPDKVLIQYASLGGLNADKAKTCLGDTKLQDAVSAEVKDAQDKLGISATPTFVLDPGAEKIEGIKSAQEFAAMFDKLLAAKK